MTEHDGDAGTFGCGRCWGSDADTVWKAKREFATVADLIDESHYGVSILACPQCAQRFVFVFTETVDWAGGDDPQASNLMPLSDAEAAELTRQGAAVTEAALAAVGPRRRCVLHRYPADSDERQNFWRTGISVGPHD